MSLKPSDPSRSGVALFGLMVLAGIVLYRLYGLQVQQHDQLSGWAKQVSVRSEVVPAFRGNLYDRNGRALAMSTPGMSLALDPAKVPAADTWLPDVAQRAGLDLDRLTQRFERAQDKRFMYVKRNLTPAEASHVMDLEVPGMRAEREARRYYPAGEIVGHLVGFTDVDGRGREGLERVFDEWLSPVDGSRKVLIDRDLGAIRYLPGGSAEAFGNDVHLTIDLDIQFVAHRALKRAALKTNSEAGSAVVLHAQTGELLAATSFPAFNPNTTSDRQPVNTRPRFLADLYEPGSTIKPFAMARAIELGLIKAEGEKIDVAPGTLRIGRTVIRDHRNYTALDATGIIKKSSNVATAKLALEMEPGDLALTLQKAGFGQSLGMSFPAEQTGGIPPKARWSDIELATLAYGYGINTTALQLAQAYTVWANDGALKPVSLIKGWEAPPSVPVFQPAVANAVLNMMAEVPEEGGTALQAKIPGYTAAGKTGTAIRAGRDGYSERVYDATFAGLFPAKNPELVVVVVLNNPRGDQFYGGNTAAPAFAEITQQAARILNIQPDQPATLVAEVSQ